MENASKALIIAGAILISIVLVSVGVIVVQSLNTDSYTEQFSEYEVEQFNSKFNNYAGTRVKGSNVRTLISSIISSNASKEQQITINTDTATSADMSAYRNTINSSHLYTVTLDYGENGLVNNINIVDNNGGSKKPTTPTTPTE